MMRAKWWPVAIFVLLATGLVLALFGVAEIGRARLETASVDASRAQLQWRRLVDLQLALLNAASAHRAFLLTGDPEDLEPMRDAAHEIPILANQLAGTYKGTDARVGAAIRELPVVCERRLRQMRQSVATYREQGPAAAQAQANSASTLETMSTFRELADITQDYEQSLWETSLAGWQRELLVVRRLNFATVLVGLILLAVAAKAMLQSLRQREESILELARQHDELQAQADTQSAELTELWGQMQNVQEEERARLSRGLHDELGGILLAARMEVTAMQRDPRADRHAIEERLERMLKALDQGIDLKRRVVEELRPTLLDTMGLVAAMRWQLEETCRLAGISCHHRFPEEEPHFNRPGAITLFRILQEAMVNIVKHAEASEVDTSLEITEDHVILSVEDNGCGALRDALLRPQSHGIAGMRHRVRVLGGQLDIDTRPGFGTRVRVKVPRNRVM